MESLSRTGAKILYGVLFVAILPVLLWAWAARTSDIGLPAIHSLPTGYATAMAGLMLIASGMLSLWRVGGGLPMNAFPPLRYVSSGIYRIFCHPIYVGFAILCVGIAIASGSPSGLWLVAPTVILASAALVLGYELPDMQLRFGELMLGQRLLPPDDEARPTAIERMRCYLTILIPWFLLYEAVVSLGIPPDAKIAYLPFESRIPVWPWTYIVYSSVYVVTGLVPLMARTRRDLRWFSIRSLVSMIIVFPIYVAIPLIAHPRAFSSPSIFGVLLNFDRAHDSAAAAFPSYHVIWAFLSASAIAGNRRQRALAFAWAFLVTASCITAGMHAIVDLAAAFIVLWIVFRIERVWGFLRGRSEALANSWREWHVGPLRIINHGAYAAAGVFAGILIIEILLGPGKDWIPLSIFAGGTIGAALWAQWIEGSPRLLRPLGFYGGMIGSVIGGVLAARWSETNAWVVLSALVVAAPWIQGIGRLRCLVQGCCHGRPASPGLGIRYTHPRSRVSRIDSLRGTPIHATPLYSLLWNLLTAIVVTRIYLLHTKATMVGGVYLILTGVGRFAEEAYRGEPQTGILAGLRLYQWLAVASVVVGALVTTISGPTVPSVPAPPHFSLVFVALVCGAAAWFVTGMDFPASNRRFARLT